MRRTIWTLILILCTQLNSKAQINWAKIEGHYEIKLAFELKNPRMMALTPDNALLITSRSGLIYRSLYPYDTVEKYLNLRGYPHGIIVRGNEVFIATTRNLWKFTYSTNSKNPDLEKINMLPGSRSGHNSRTLGLSPNNEIFLSLGISGNCDDEWVDKSYENRIRRGGLLKLNENTNVWEPYASGLRNPVGFEWHPETKKLYATNNGPDHLGYELPKEVMVEIEQGDFFGMPWFQYINGSVVRDHCIKSESPMPIENVKKPFTLFDARNAPMDIEFYDINGDGILEGIVALRGSWGQRPGEGAASRRHPKLMSVNMQNGAIAEWVTGFQLDNGHRFARPVGLLSGPEGRLFFTSDGGETEGLFVLTPTQ